MAVKIRLSRIGTKKRPMYRLVVTDARKPRDGRCLEVVGHYNPNVKPEVFKLDDERFGAWIKQGARPSATVQRLINQERRRLATAAKEAQP